MDKIYSCVYRTRVLASIQNPYNDDDQKEETLITLIEAFLSLQVIVFECLVLLHAAAHLASL